MIEIKSVIGNRPYFFKVNDIEGLDVDNPVDFEIAEYLFKKINKIK